MTEGMTRVTDQQPDVEALGNAEVMRPAMITDIERAALRNLSVQHLPT